MTNLVFLAHVTKLKEEKGMKGKYVLVIPSKKLDEVKLALKSSFKVTLEEVA